MKLYVFLWAQHLAAMIVAEAYSAEVAAYPATAAPPATPATFGLAVSATKAGSHSHKGDTPLPA